MSKMREELIKELKSKIDPNWNEIANFIIEDRKRVVEPLVKIKFNYREGAIEVQHRIVDAIEETLKNAGVENE